ncbi:MAG: hypothetical protein U0R19_11700 [Bryobacteraceae bacterium]
MAWIAGRLSWMLPDNSPSEFTTKLSSATRARVQREGLEAIALWEKEHGRFTAEEMREAYKRVREQLRGADTRR